MRSTLWVCFGAFIGYLVYVLGVYVVASYPIVSSGRADHLQVIALCIAPLVAPVVYAEGNTADLPSWLLKPDFICYTLMTVGAVWLRRRTERRSRTLDTPHR
jgi:hypothetical protein